jgi:hypothetical protein
MTTAIDDVVTQTTFHGVVALVTIELIRAATTNQQIIAGKAVNPRRQRGMQSIVIATNHIVKDVVPIDDAIPCVIRTTVVDKPRSPKPLEAAHVALAVSLQSITQVDAVSVPAMALGTTPGSQLMIVSTSPYTSVAVPGYAQGPRSQAHTDRE